MTGFVGASQALSTPGLDAVLDDLGVGPAELIALLLVESKSCGFLPDRRPVILFERHWFHELTGGRFSAANPDISNPVAGGYAGLAAEYPRLEKAARLDRVAALQSASWGAGQVMGFNHLLAGHADVDGMVAAMQDSEDAQLLAVAGFLKARHLAGALQSHDWARVAKAYNGASYAKNQYDVRLAAMYSQLSSGTLPDIDVRRAQLYLTFLGYAPGSVDGLHGKLSRSAVAEFRQAQGLEDGDRVDKALVDALRAKVQAL